jgi:hypothetical protein
LSTANTHTRAAKQRLKLQDALTWCVDGASIVSSLYSLLQHAHREVYISAKTIDWNLLLDAQHQITLLDILAHLCNNEVRVHILLSERSSEGPIPIPGELQHPNCAIKVVPRFGPTIKESVHFWVPSLDQMLLNYQKTPIAQFNNLTLEQIGDKRVFQYNCSYVMVDRKLALLGAFDLDSTLQRQVSSLGHHRADKDDDRDDTNDEDVDEQQQHNSTGISRAPRGGASNNDDGGFGLPRALTSQLSSWFNTAMNSIQCSLHPIISTGSSAPEKYPSAKYDDDHNMPSAAITTTSTTTTTTTTTTTATESVPLFSMSADYYHRVNVVTRCTPSMCEYFLKNWLLHGRATPLRSLTPEIQLVGSFPLFPQQTNNNNNNHNNNNNTYNSSCSTEATVLKKMFAQAQQLIYIETPHLHSTDVTQNRIVYSVLKRLIHAHETCLRHESKFDADPVRAVILTNANYTGLSLSDRMDSLHTNQTAIAINAFAATHHTNSRTVYSWAICTPRPTISRSSRQ